MTKEALKMALAEFENQRAGLEEVGVTDHSLDKLITAIKEALSSPNGEAQPAVALEQEPVAFDRQVLDSWTKEYKAEADYWKARHDVLLQALKNISSDAKQKESVGVVTGCASHGDYFTVVLRSKILIPDETLLYTTPPQRTWIGLTDEDWTYMRTNCGSIRSAVETAEAKLKEKNT